MKCGNTREDEQYPILILAYHGNTDGIWVTDQPEVETEDEDESPVVQLQDIAKFLEGRCKNKVVHFASCSTINVSNSTIGEFDAVRKRLGFDIRERSKPA